ncbi:hypothetical protein HK100_007962 [Physocladia obscura]|uniref:SCP domain-containing protein n=1 Tax=Physocladia obscura TaxID=109957 RepID=A0AAD5TBY0_9FUNG|nr:hypothetical protein HK100_007962 [Physocladia obscura]
MDLPTFNNMNKNLTSFNCTDGTNQLVPPIVVCITKVVFENTTGAAFNGTTGASIPLPGAGSSNRPDGAGGLVIRSSTTTILIRTATATSNHTDATITAGNGTLSVNVNGTTIADGNSTTSVITLQTTQEVIVAPSPSPIVIIQTTSAPAPSPSPTEPPVDSDAGGLPFYDDAYEYAPCDADGTLDACKGWYAETDNPPSYYNWTQYTLEVQCLTYINYARQHYNPGVWDLAWDPWLAEYAAYSSAYSAYYGCWDCHTYSGSGYSWGQNLFLDETDCASAYFGWVTNEAAGNDPANPDEGHFTNIVGFAATYVTVGCANGYQNDRWAVVCNFGLVVLSDQTGLVPIFSP